MTGPTNPAPSPSVLRLSAASADALDGLRTALAEHLVARPDLDLVDVATTLRTGRRRHPHRLAVAATTVSDAVAALRAARIDPDPVAESGAGVALLLPGQGIQLVGMYRHLYAQEPAFAAAVDACADGFAAHLDTDMRDLLFGDGGDGDTDRLRRTEYTQPAVFTVGTALADLLRDRGVEPVALLGHSIGELTAAHLAGVVDLGTACRLVAERGRLAQAMEPGVMAQVPLAEATVRELVEDVPEVEVCAVNAPQLTVVGGPEDAVRAWLRAVDETDAPLLAVSHAFHTAAMDPAARAFADVVASADLRPPTCPVVSNVTGAVLTAAEATDPAYWGRQLRSTVRFADGLTTLVASTDPQVAVLVDAGSRGFAARVAALVAGRDRPVVGIATDLDPDAQATAFAATLGALWAHGVDVDPSTGATGDRPPRRLRLPTYPFARDRHWVDPRPRAAAPPPPVPAAQRLDPARWFWTPTWPAADTARCATPAGPWVVFAPDTDLGHAVVDALRERYGDVRVAWSGDRLELDSAQCRADPGRRDHQEQALAALCADVAPAGVVAAWGLTDPPAPRTAFDDVLRFAQACAGELADGPPVRLHFVTRGAIAAGHDDEIVADRATALGVARVLPLEAAGLDTQVVDLDPAADPAAAIRSLATALNLPDTTVALRAGLPHTLRFVPVTVPAGPPPIRAGGTYLVTGGLGGIGRAIASWLGTHGARVLLTGRRPSSDATALLDRLAADGVDATYAQADVTSPADLAAAVARTGPVHGVFQIGRAHV